MSSEAIHETILRDAIDLIDDVKNIDVDKLSDFETRPKSFKSISHASEEMTLVFPVMFPDDLNVKTAMMISKAIERKAVTMLQMLFSAFYFTDAEDGIGYLRQFHTNMDLGPELSFDNVMAFATSIDGLEESGRVVVTDREALDRAKADLANINTYLPDNISEDGLDTYKIFSAYGELNILQEGRSRSKDKDKSKGRDNHDGGGQAPVVSSPKPETGSDKKDDKKSPTDKSKTGKKPHSNKNTKTSGAAKDMADLYTALDKRNSLIRNQVFTTDIKKANELVPTLMEVNFFAAPGINGKTPIKVESMVIGVKAKLYPVRSKDIVTRIITKHKDNNYFFNFIKATTREISFWRDFIFAIDKAKIDALSNSRKGSSSKMWKVLERRSKKSKIRRLLGSTNTAMAITTLVVSQNEVEYLKKYENIDIENPSIMRPIMESYNLMGVCIVDEALEIVRFLFDTGDDTYEILSFDGLEKESDNDSYKKIINLLTKIR